MTEEQKDSLIAKMLDAPSSLSDEELEAILHDDELRDIYDVSAALSNACTPQPEPDMEAEWLRFRPRLRRKPTTMRWILRVAAIFLGAVLASGIAVRVFDNIFTADSPQPAIAKVDTVIPARTKPAALPAEQEASAAPEPAIKKCRAVEPARYISKVELSGEDTEIDIDEFLRIQQARVDHNLAIQAAESFLDEYDDLAPILDAAGLDNPALDCAIRKVTLE